MLRWSHYTVAASHGRLARRADRADVVHAVRAQCAIEASVLRRRVVATWAAQTDLWTTTVDHPMRTTAPSPDTHRLLQFATTTHSNAASVQWNFIRSRSCILSLSHYSDMHTGQKGILRKSQEHRAMVSDNCGSYENRSYVRSLLTDFEKVDYSVTRDSRVDCPVCVHKHLVAPQRISLSSLEY